MSVRLKIEQVYEELTNTDQKIVNYIFSNGQSVVHDPISVLAKTTQTSPASWDRLSKKLGYSGIKELKLNLALDANLDDEKVNEGWLIEGNDSVAQIMKKHEQTLIETVKETMQLLNVDELEKAVNLIINCKTVYLIGVGGNNIICNDIQQKLSRVGKRVIYNNDGHNALMSIEHVTSEDCLICVSYSGETPEISIAARRAKELDCPIIAIIGYHLDSKLQQLADIILSIPVEKENVRLGFISSRNAMLIVSDLIYYGVVSQEFSSSKNAIINTRQLTDELKRYK